MSRTVVRIHKDGKGTLSFNLEEADGEFDDPDNLRELDVAADQKLFESLGSGVFEPDLVKQVGTALYERLASHAAVEAAFGKALQSRPNTVAPIYMYLIGEVEAVPWETLFAKGQFLALDRRWQIGRIAGTTAGVKPDLLEGKFDPPLRIMAVLAARGVSADAEWDALYTATRQFKVPVAFDVWVAEDELYAKIKALGNTAISLHWVPDEFDIADTVAGLPRAPHILHFFCHGSNNGGTPHLELVTRLGFDDPAVPLVEIDPPDLVKANSSGDIWLVALNCCRGAAAAEDVTSYARRLMTSGYFPAVLGMREAVAADDANLVCRWTYAGLGAALAEIVGSERPGQVDWASVLYQSRFRLCNKYKTSNQDVTAAAAATKQWTLPVLYVRSQPFTIVPPRPKPGFGLGRAPQSGSRDREKLAAKLDKLRSIRANLAVDTPQDALDEFDRQIELLEAQLYPPSVAAALREARDQVGSSIRASLPWLTNKPH